MKWREGEPPKVIRAVLRTLALFDIEPEDFLREYEATPPGSPPAYEVAIRKLVDKQVSSSSHLDIPDAVIRAYRQLLRASAKRKRTRLTEQEEDDLIEFMYDFGYAWVVPIALAASGLRNEEADRITDGRVEFVIQRRQRAARPNPVHGRRSQATRSNPTRAQRLRKAAYNLIASAMIEKGARPQVIQGVLRILTWFDIEPEDFLNEFHAAQPSYMPEYQQALMNIINDQMSKGADLPGVIEDTYARLLRKSEKRRRVKLTEDERNILLDGLHSDLRKYATTFAIAAANINPDEATRIADDCLTYLVRHREPRPNPVRRVRIPGEALVASMGPRAQMVYATIMRLGVPLSEIQYDEDSGIASFWYDDLKIRAVIQVFPGTPLYVTARKRGLPGRESDATTNFEREFEREWGKSSISVQILKAVKYFQRIIFKHGERANRWAE